MDSENIEKKLNVLDHNLYLLGQYLEKFWKFLDMKQMNYIVGMYKDYGEVLRGFQFHHITNSDVLLYRLNKYANETWKMILDQLDNMSKINSKLKSVKRCPKCNHYFIRVIVCGSDIPHGNYIETKCGNCEHQWREDHVSEKNAKF